MQIYKIVKCLCIIMCISIQGCKSAKELNLEKKDITTNTSYIYGQGSGSSLEVAKQYAIQDLATNLQVSIKYSMQQNTLQKDNTLQTSGLSNTFLESKIKDIPQIEVEKTWKKGNNIYVRVRVSKSVLEGIIKNRIQNAEQKLQAMLNSCETIAFSKYNNFKKIFMELQNDITLYQILTKDTSYGNTTIATFQNALATLPMYKIKWDLQNLYGCENELRSIITAELSKFIKINTQATRTLHITTTNDNTLRLFLNFKDCNDNPENTIQIDTRENKKDILKGKQRVRVGAVIYKTIEANY